MPFRMTFLVVCHQLEVLSIKLALFQEHLYQIGRLIGAILKRLMRFKGKWGVDVKRIHSREHDSLCSYRASYSKKRQNLVNVCGLSSY